MNVDFSMLRANPLDPVTKAIEEYGNYIVAERARREKMEQEKINADRNFELAQQRTDAITAREDRAEREQNAEREAANARERAKVDAGIRGDVAAGDLVSARQRAGDYAEVDPSTGTVTRGRPFEVKDRVTGPDPEAPVDLPEGAEGPQATPEIARHAGKMDIANGQTLTPYADYESEMANRDRQRAMGPVVKIGDVETSMDELRHAKDRQNAADFDKVGDALQGELKQALESGDPYLRQMALRRSERFSQLRAGVEAGTIKPFDAMKQMMSGADLADKYGENRVHDQTVGEYGLQRQRIANQKPTADKSRTAGTGGIDRKDLTSIETSLNNFQKQWNLSSDRAEDTRLRGLLKNKDVSVVQRSLSDVLSRSLAGQKGVLTDADIGRLQSHMGGTIGDLQNYVSKMATGDLDPQVFSKLMQGVDVVLQNHDANRKAAKAAFDKNYGEGSPWGNLKVGDMPKRKRFEFFGDDEPAAGGAPSGETKEQRMARLKALLGR